MKHLRASFQMVHNMTIGLLYTIGKVLNSTLQWIWSYHSGTLDVYSPHLHQHITSLDYILHITQNPGIEFLHAQLKKASIYCWTFNYCLPLFSHIINLDSVILFELHSNQRCFILIESKATLKIYHKKLCRLISHSNCSAGM